MPKINDKVVINNEEYLVCKSINGKNNQLSFKSLSNGKYFSIINDNNELQNENERDSDYCKYSFYIEFENGRMLISNITTHNNNSNLVEIFLYPCDINDSSFKSELNESLMISNNWLKYIYDKIEILESKIERMNSIINYNNPIVKVPKAIGLIRDFQINGSNLLMTFDRICRNAKIDYWLIDGTLLGAVRHKGFIPWDDDIDVCMTYENFIEFKKIIINEMSSIIDFYDFEPYSYKIFMKGKQSWIDIFVFYYIPDNIDTKSHKTSYDQIYKESQLLLKNEGIDNYRMFVTNKLQEISSNSRTEKMFRGLQTYSKKYYTISTDMIYPLNELDFEGHMYYIPNKALSILREVYGNFYEYPSSLKSNHVITQY